MTGSTVANSPLLYGLIAIGLLFAVWFSLVSYKKAKTRCLELGISSETISAVVKSSITSSIVPSLAVLVGLVTLSVSLGAAWPWWRLSVIGSLSYETMATTYTIAGMNIEPSQVLSAPATVFAAIILVMTICIMIEPLAVAFLAKKYSTGLMKASKTSDWGQVLTGVFFLGMFAVYLPIMLFTDLPTSFCLITSFAVTILCGMIGRKMKWLNNFTMALAMIIGMASSVLWVALF